MKSKANKLLLLLVAMLWSTAIAYAQKTVTGNVVDQQGEPVIGANVLVKGTSNGTITDMSGNFSIQGVAANAILQVSYIGYKTEEMPAKSPVKVVLKEDNDQLDEVVVIGFGTVKKRDLTGSVASVKSEALLQTPTSSVASTLQGRIAGLDVNGSDLRIRGNRSINGSNDPLVIIDGVQGGSMSDLNPSDIESVDVLKDASSTAIYGSQGANGVIIITTKKAQEGKMKVSYDGYVTLASRVYHPAYRSGENYYNALKTAAQNAGLWSSEADDYALFGNSESYAAYKANAWTDYERLLTKTTTVSNRHSLNISGGNDRTSARFSVGYANDGSKWKKSGGTDKYTMRANIDHKVYKWLSAGITVSLAHKTTESSPYEKSSVTDVELGSPYGYYDADTNSYIIGNTLVTRPLASDGYVNPLVDTYNYDRYSAKSYSTNIVANGYLDIHPIDGLTFRTQLNANYNNSSSGSYLDANSSTNIASASGTKNSASETKSNTTYTEWNNILTYNFKMLPENHHLGVTLLTSWNKSVTDYLSATSLGQTIVTNLWYNLGSNDGEDGSVYHSSNYSQSQSFSYAGRVSYDWKSRYLFTASLRRDGASRLADGHKWDSFPSAAFAWRASDEPFMESTKDWMDDLKVRATYGVTGNSGIGVYGTTSGVTSASTVFAFQDEAANRYLLGKVDSGNYIIGNKNTKWERSTTFDVGFDLTMLKNRVTVTFDWYNTKTTDLLLLRQLPTSSGMDGKYATYTNIGATRNRGFELSINSRNIVTKDFNWNSTVTFSANRERILELTDGNDIVTIGSSKETNSLMVGHPIKSYRTFKYLGIWKTDEAEEAATYFKDEAKTIPFQPGDIKVADLNGDHYISESDDITYLGSTSPNWYASFNNDFRYKQWDFNLYIYARWGMWGESPTAGYNPSTGGAYENFNYWQAGTNEWGDMPMLYKGRKLSDYVGYQSLGYCEQSFIKLKRFTVGYTVPKSILKMAHIESVRIYATANDPLYYVKNDWLKHRDPEGNQQSVTFGLNVNF